MTIKSIKPDVNKIIQIAYAEADWVQTQTGESMNPEEFQRLAYSYYLSLEVPEKWQPHYKSTDIKLTNEEMKLLWSGKLRWGEPYGQTEPPKSPNPPIPTKPDNLKLYDRCFGHPKPGDRELN